MININVEYGEGYYVKLNNSFYNSVFEDVISEVTNNAMELCMEECPVDTGLLRDSHSVSIDGLTGSVENSTDYWIYVVYGTYKMSANNYPERVASQIISSNTIVDIVNNALSENGII